MRFRSPILSGVVLALILSGQPGASLADDFTFKRVKAGTGLAGKRITVQIDPEEQARFIAALPKINPYPEASDPKNPPTAKAGDDVTKDAAPVAPAKSAYAWFWENVPTALGANDDRFFKALANLSQGPGGAQVSAPRLQHMQEIAQTHGTDILKATLGTKVSPAMVLAVIGIESAGKTEAVSSAGAVGLMQLIPATAERFGVKDSTDAVDNIKGGVAYLDWLMGEFDGDPLMVIAAYNSGEGAVRANDGVPPFAETRDYVPKVLAAWQVAQGLCQSPPELMSDPCVFKVIGAGG